MRKSVAVIAALGCAFVSMPNQAKADGGVLAAATVGFVGGAIIGAHASPYYYGPYGYAPAYYHAAPSYGYAPAYASGYGVPTYGYSQPYYVTSPCWGRRLPVYDRYGGVVAIRYERACR